MFGFQEAGLEGEWEESCHSPSFMVLDQRLLSPL